MRIPTLPRSVSPPGSVRNGRWKFRDAQRGLLPCTRWSAIESLLRQASVSKCSPYETTFIAASESNA